jgi:hypothetical protein
MSFRSDVVDFGQSVDGSLGRLDRFLKLSDARERRALAGRVSVTYAHKSQADSRIHGLLVQVLRAAATPSKRGQLGKLAQRLRHVEAKGPGAQYLRAVADLAEASFKLSRRTHKYDPDQPRDPETGQWVEGWGSASETINTLPAKTASGIKSVVSGAVSGAADKLASGAKAVRTSVNQIASDPVASTMVVEGTILAAAVAFFFYFRNSAAALQVGLGAVDAGLKALRFLRRIP